MGGGEYKRSIELGEFGVKEGRKDRLLEKYRRRKEDKHTHTRRPKIK